MSCQPAVSQTQGRSVATVRTRLGGWSARGKVSVFIGASSPGRRVDISALGFPCPPFLDPDQGLGKPERAMCPLRAARRRDSARPRGAPIGEIRFMAVAGYADPATGHAPA